MDRNRFGATGQPLRPGTPLPVAEPNPLRRALDDYHHMEDEVIRTRADSVGLRTQNQSLIAEVGMLREALERSDNDRVRLQAVSSTLLGRLLAINDVIGGAVKASIKDGIEAAAVAPDVKLEQDAKAIQAVLQRVSPAASDKEPPVTLPNQRPPQVDWSMRRPIIVDGTAEVHAD